MPSSTSDAHDFEGPTLNAPRADFIASLGRKIDDARALMGAFEDPPSALARDELRRRLHALRSGARLLRLDAMASSLDEALVVLERASRGGALGPEDVAFVAQVLDDIPALAWGESHSPTDTPPAPSDRPGTEVALARVSVLVVGSPSLAAQLDGVPGSPSTRSFERERTEDIETALELARAYAPDVLVIDADVAGTTQLVENLLNDPLTEPVPLVVVGAWTGPEGSARFVALGVSKTLSKPLDSGALMRACDDVLDAREGRTMRVTLGEPTVEQLADRLAREVKEGLVGGVDRAARSVRIPLGEGTEVMGAVWGAIARVREVVTRRTDGAVRYTGMAPEGAIAVAPWLHHDVAASERMSVRARGPASDVRLHGRSVVVADDDPGVTWFIADLLRTAGCDVHEALDGSSALDLAIRLQPDLVVTDILMPGMDGFALSRALRRDVALRDTPVILLSWKEDLLQRVRELGASAAAYMRKESDSRSILARVREVLRPRARVEARLQGDGEVRGRLDGLTTRLLLELACALRGNARVSVRDATDLYEIEIRDAAPRKVTRTASDGNFIRGQRALSALLGISAGRFSVVSSAESVRGELTGTLFEQLATPIASARGALAASTGTRTIEVERIGLDPESTAHYLVGTPEPAKTMVARLAAGESPRQMILEGQVAPRVLDDLLADLASRGVITSVEGMAGEDLLGPAVDAARAVLRGAQAGERTPSVRPTVAEEERGAGPGLGGPEPRIFEGDDLGGGALSISPSSIRPSPGPVSLVPSSLEDAVIRQISDRSPQPPLVSSARPPIVEPSALRRRSSSPPSRPLSAEFEHMRTQQSSVAASEEGLVPAQARAEELTPVPEPALPVEPSDSRKRTLLAITVVLLGAALGAIAWLFGADLLHP
ncbi:MAG: response regulator [Polyangiaceae bacterium]|jgi:DNA-binding response OmpR family regulator